MENKAVGGKKEEATIFEKTTTGFKELPDDQLVKSLQWEQAHNKLMIATVDVARQVERTAWDLADVTVVGRGLLPTHVFAKYPKNVSLINLYYEYMGRLEADREPGAEGSREEVMFVYASPNKPPPPSPSRPDTEVGRLARPAMAQRGKHRGLPGVGCGKFERGRQPEQGGQTRGPRAAGPRRWRGEPRARSSDRSTKPGQGHGQRLDRQARAQETAK